MKTLSETWFAEGYLDFEQKQYTVLAYLQHVNATFLEKKLYPQLADITFHYNNLVAFKDNKNLVQLDFPERINNSQIERLRQFFDHVTSSDELMKEISAIIDYALRKMQQMIDYGMEVYKAVEEKFKIVQVGPVPPTNSEGYFLLNNPNKKDTLIYQYQLATVINGNDKKHEIISKLIDSRHIGLTATYDEIFSDIVSKNGPVNPAVYVIETPFEFPLEETIVPVAKKHLAKYLSAATIFRRRILVQ